MERPTMIPENIATGVLQNHKIKHLLNQFQKEWLEFKKNMTSGLGYQMTSLLKMNRVLTLIKNAGSKPTLENIDTSMLDMEEVFMLENYLKQQLTYFVLEAGDIYGISCVFYKLLDTRIRVLVEMYLNMDYSAFIATPNWSEIRDGFHDILRHVKAKEDIDLLDERIYAFCVKIDFFTAINKIGENIVDEFEREMAVTSKNLKAAKKTMIAHNYEDYFRRQYAKQDSMMLEYNLIKNHYTQFIEN